MDEKIISFAVWVIHQVLSRNFDSSKRKEIVSLARDKWRKVDLLLSELENIDAAPRME